MVTIHYSGMGFLTPSGPLFLPSVAVSCCFAFAYFHIKSLLHNYVSLDLFPVCIYEIPPQRTRTVPSSTGPLADHREIQRYSSPSSINTIRPMCEHSPWFLWRRVLYD